MENKCNCKVAHCYNGHFPMGEDEDGGVVDWGGCPECVVDGVHTCET